jgi:hypothetical protein
MSVTYEIIREMGVRRYNGKCKCGAPVSRLLEGSWVSKPKTVGHGLYARHTTERTFQCSSQGDVAVENGWATIMCGCGRTVELVAVNGKVRDAVLCDSRCTSATGHNCECECGGENHGADHA